MTIKELRSWCNKSRELRISEKRHLSYVSWPFRGDKLQAKWIPEMLVTMPSIPKGPTGKPARINLAKKLELEPLEGVPKDLEHPGL